MADLIHLKLTNIKGESASKSHRDEIAVESWNWGISQLTSLVVGAGGTAGKGSFTPFSWTHRADIASPLLWKACATGQHIPEATLSVARPLSTAGDYLTLHMTDVLITSVGLSDAASDTAPPTESVSMTFATFEYSYRPQMANGSLGPAVTFRYDIHANRVM